MTGNYFDSTRNNRGSEARMIQDALTLDAGLNPTSSDPSLETFSGSRRSYDRIPTPANFQGNPNIFNVRRCEIGKVKSIYAIRGLVP